ncbi:MAG: hypothetical protein ACRENN_08860, partial [Candidatus Eiseniibacteriota bacterium]
ALVVGGEGYLIYKAWGKYQNELDAASAGDQVAKDKYYNEKVNYIWWAIAAHLLQMADAYVDAHLGSFDADFGPDEPQHAEGTLAGPDLGAAPSPGAKIPGVRAALRVHF